MLIKLTEAECRAAIRDGDFSEAIRKAAHVTVLALTQSWCPQWTRMRPFLEEASAEGVGCYYLEYDRESFFDDFRDFKESAFRNDQVPYFRYYRDGTFYKEGNYIDRRGFRKTLGLD